MSRSTKKLADGTVVSVNIFDEDSSDNTYINRSYDGESYNVHTNDTTLNDAGRITEIRHYLADSIEIESFESFNVDDYKTEEYLYDTETYTYTEDGKILSIVSEKTSQCEG